MPTDFQFALWISLIGMGLVFIAILLLWGMMALMARIPDAEQEEPGPQVVIAEDVPTLADSPLPADTEENSRRQKAAAAAVAAAMAQRQPISALAAAVAVAAVAAARSNQTEGTATPMPDGNISSWQAILRAGRYGQSQQIYHRKNRGSQS